MPVNNQQYRGEIEVFYNKISVIKCYYNFLDFHNSYSARIFDFGSLLLILDLLASFHFESPDYYVVIILQCTRRVNFYTLTSSHIFQVLFFHTFISNSRLTKLSGDDEKILDLILSLIKVSQFATGTLIALLCKKFSKI